MLWIPTFKPGTGCDLPAPSTGGHCQPELYLQFLPYVEKKNKTKTNQKKHRKAGNICSYQRLNEKLLLRCSWTSKDINFYCLFSFKSPVLMVCYWSVDE